MYQLTHILVPLDLSEMDDFLIRYSNFMIANFKPKSITFMHVMQSYDIPDDVLSDFPEMEEPLQKMLQDELKNKVDEILENEEVVKINVIVEEGVTTEEIVDYAKSNEITLTLMGKKMGYKGRGSTVRRVLGLIPSSVLLISETTPHHLNHIMVRIDFTKISGMALKMGLKLRDLTGAKVTCHNVYKLPLHYLSRPVRGERGKIEEQITSYARKEYTKFARKLKVNPEEVPCTYSLDTENEEAHILYNQALKTGADMIIIGSKIKSEYADVILDSTSEELAGPEKNIPVFVMKDRKQTMGFLDALFD